MKVKRSWKAIFLPLTILLVSFLFWLFDKNMGPDFVVDQDFHQLKFLADFNIPTGEKFADSEIGGLSGLFYDEAKDVFWAISDSKGKDGPIRAFQFEIKIDNGKLSVQPKNVVYLKDAKGREFPLKTLDPEGLVVLKSGEIIVSSEGQLEDSPFHMPEMLIFNAQGLLKSRVPVDSKFLPRAKDHLDQGVFNNLAFESLAVSDDEAELYMATESSLLQDTSEAQFQKGFLPNRLITFDLKANPPMVIREVIYPLSALYLPTLSTVKSLKGVSGLVDLLPYGRDQFFSVDRTYSFVEQSHVIRIYSTNCKTATNVQKMVTVNDHPYVTCAKHLVLDLGKITSELTPPFQSLDNIEGLAFGPRLANGHRTLILVGDNNFNRMQRTQFLAFEILEPKTTN